MALPIYADEIVRSPKRRYSARLRLPGEYVSYAFEISVNGSNVYYNGDMTEDLQLSILDQNDSPFPKGRPPYFEFIPLTHESRKRKDEFISAFRRFLEGFCCEKEDFDKA